MKEKSVFGSAASLLALLAIGCGAQPARTPTDVMERVNAELAHTIEPVGDATLNSATLQMRTPRPIDTELDAEDAPKTWGTDETGGPGDADLLENPYTRKRYEASR